MRPAHLKIDLSAIAGNIGTVRRLVGPKVRLIAVVKADAYGHGAVPAARACLAAGADMLAVALLEEGVELRREGVFAPILVLGPMLPRQAPHLVEWGLSVAVSGLDLAEALNATAARQARLATAHLKVDTGMSRLGVRVEDIEALAPRLASLPHVRWEGILSHLAAPTDDPAFTSRQIGAFERAVAVAEVSLGPLPYRHLVSSAAICCLPASHFTAVRPGNMLYGLIEGLPEELLPPLRPAMSLQAPIALLKRVRAAEPVGYGCTWQAARDTTLAIVPVGYADGYPRSLGNTGEALIGGQRRPIVGRVCMDSLSVDLASATATQVGDEVVLLGQQGGAEITALELAQKANTITQEIVSRMGARLPRFYTSDEGCQ